MDSESKSTNRDFFSLIPPESSREQERLSPADLTSGIENDTMYRTNAHAVIIGINQYNDTGIRNLNFARADAEAVFEVLVDPHLGCIDPDNVTLLVDEKATQRNIRSEIGTKLRRRADKEDTVLIYFAGHGAPEIDPDSKSEDGLKKYLVPYDAAADDLFATGVSMDEIQVYFNRIVSRQIIFFVDSCYSGDAGGRSFQNSNYQTRAHLTNAFLDTLAGEGRTVVTACDVNEVSLETSELGHGLFTYHLVEGLKGKADQNKDGFVGADELYKYVYENVVKSSRKMGGSMHPLRKGFMRGEVILSRFETEDKKNARTFNEQARALFDEGKLDEAFQLWETVVQLDPQNAMASKGMTVIAKKWHERDKQIEKKQRVLLEHRRSGALSIDEFARGLDLLKRPVESLDETESRILDYIHHLTANKISVESYLMTVKLLTTNPEESLDIQTPLPKAFRDSLVTPKEAIPPSNQSPVPEKTSKKTSDKTSPVDQPQIRYSKAPDKPADKPVFLRAEDDLLSSNKEPQPHRSFVAEVQPPVAPAATHAPVKRNRSVIVAAAVGLLAIAGFLVFRFAMTPAPGPVGASYQFNITTSPDDAEVLIDGTLVGTTPVTYEMAGALNNPIQIKLQKEGHTSLDTTVVFTQDTSLSLNTVLAPILVAGELPPDKAPVPEEKSQPPSTTVPQPVIAPEVGTMVIRSEPIGADLFIDGVAEGKTPMSIKNMASGQHEIKLVLDYHETYTASVDLETGTTRNVNGVLQPQMGTLEIGVYPSGKLIIDGKLVKDGVVQAESVTVPAGIRKVRVEHPTYGYWEQSINIQPNTKKGAVLVNFTRKVKLTVSTFYENSTGKKEYLQGVEILVDGEQKGYTPAVIEMPVGVRSIVSRKEGFQQDRAPFLINVDQKMAGSLEIKLQKN